MDSKLLEEAKILKGYAKLDIDRATQDKNNIDFKKLLDSALSRLTTAIKMLEADYEESADENYKDKLRRQLADCYGIKGGVFRRLAEEGDAKANLEKAAGMYDEGRQYETDNSYNLSNSVIIPILIDPEKLEKQQEQTKINSGIKKIEELVRGKRKYDWWVWTDLGLLKLLRNDYQGARGAYEQATQLGASSTNYKSTLSALEQLSRTLSGSPSPTARSVA